MTSVIPYEPHHLDWVEPHPIVRAEFEKWQHPKADREWRQRSIGSTMYDDDGNIAGIVGIRPFAFGREPDGVAWCYGWFIPTLYTRAGHMVRFTKLALRLMNVFRVRGFVGILAERNIGHPETARWLDQLGFERIGRRGPFEYWRQRWVA